MFLQKIVNVFGHFEHFMEHAFAFLSLNVPAESRERFCGFEHFEHFMEHAFTFLLLNVPAQSCELYWWF